MGTKSYPDGFFKKFVPELKGEYDWYRYSVPGHEHHLATNVGTAPDYR